MIHPKDTPYKAELLAQRIFRSNTYQDPLLLTGSTPFGLLHCEGLSLELQCKTWVLLRGIKSIAQMKYPEDNSFKSSIEQVTRTFELAKSNKDLIEIINSLYDKAERKGIFDNGPSAKMNFWD